MTQTPHLPPHKLVQRYRNALSLRERWESVWQDCYRFALPNRARFTSRGSMVPASEHVDIFDSTAADASDQLAASLMSQLTPPFGQWIGFEAGSSIDEETARKLQPKLDQVAIAVQQHFNRSNFTVEIHQCYLDSVIGGTASLLFEEAAPGSSSAFRFSAIPLHDLVVEEGGEGRLSGNYRQHKLTLEQLTHRFPDAQLPTTTIKRGQADSQLRFTVLEAVVPDDKALSYHALLIDSSLPAPLCLKRGRFSQSPYITFRWQKSPGEIYGRSPVMKVLPDIRTANRVVELILKNASIAVTGIWQADDDGILNPEAVQLIPGTIIPKAVGSAGLTPLKMPGDFDVSQLVLADLRTRIQRALLVDQLSLPDSKMTATEVIARNGQMAQLLGATYGRLQCELLEPLIRRAVSILTRRGEIPAIPLDGVNVVIRPLSPLARAQRLQDLSGLLQWIDTTSRLGGSAQDTIDIPAVVRRAGRALGVPERFLRSMQPESANENDATPSTSLTKG